MKSFDFSNAVWANPTARGGKGKNTVSEKVDVYIGHNHNTSCKKEYMAVRFYGKKFKEMFGDAGGLAVGFIGSYLLVRPGDDYKCYNLDSNPEIRIPVEEVKRCGRDYEKMLGGYLLKKDEMAGLCYVDTSIGARA